MALRDVPRGVVDRWSALLLVVLQTLFISVRAYGWTILYVSRVGDSEAA